MSRLNIQELGLEAAIREYISKAPGWFREEFFDTLELRNRWSGRREHVAFQVLNLHPSGWFRVGAFL